MKYYLKHLFRVIRRQKTQSILLMLILAFTFTVQYLCLTTSSAIREEYDRKNEATYGDAAVTVTLSAGSPTRFLTVTPIEQNLPFAKATGTFALPYLDDDTLLQGYAVDFDSVGTIFPLSFSSYVPFSAQEREDALFVTRAFAKAHGVKAGDTVTLSLFGRDVTYVVRGISEVPLLGDGDAVCDLRGVVKMLTAESSFLQFFSDDFKLYGTLYVTSDTVSAVALQDAVRELYPNETVSMIEKQDAGNGFAVFEAISFAVVLLSLLASLAVAVGCVWCLSKQRREYTDLFALVGYSKRRAFWYRVLEMLFYTGPAVGIGSAVSACLAPAMFRRVGISFVTYRFRLPYFLLALGSLLLVSVLAPLIADSRRLNGNGKKIRRASAHLPLILCGGAAALCFILSFALPVALKFATFAVGIVCILLFVFFVTQPLLSLFATRGNGRRTQRGVTPQALARKNCTRVGELSNTCRLLAMLSLLLLLIVFSIGATRAMNTVLTGYILDGSLVIAGGTDTSAEIVRGLPQVDTVYPIRIQNGVKTAGDFTAHCWGVTDSRLFRVKDGFELPGVGGVAAASYETRARGLVVNGAFDATADGVTRQLTLEAELRTGLPVFVTHYDTFPNAPTYYVVKAAEGVDDTALSAALTEALSLQMVSVIPVASLFEFYVNNVISYLYFAEATLCLVAVFGAVGIIGNLYESLRSRREELTSFTVCGLTRKRVRRMLCHEALHVLLTALLTIILTVVPAALLLENGVQTFAASLLVMFRDYIYLVL